LISNISDLIKTIALVLSGIASLIAIFIAIKSENRNAKRFESGIAAQKEIAEKSLKAAWLWELVKDKLDHPALELPLDQQQRLCIARLLAIQPEVILMDEPCSALDPIATMKIEELMIELKKDYTIVIVTHNMQQASRVSDYTGYMLLGKMIEFDKTKNIFIRPKEKLTEDYISGKYG